MVGQNKHNGFSRSDPQRLSRPVVLEADASFIKSADDDDDGDDDDERDDDDEGDDDDEVDDDGRGDN